MYPYQQKGVPENLHSNLCFNTFSVMNFPLPRSLNKTSGIEKPIKQTKNTKPDGKHRIRVILNLSHQLVFSVSRNDLKNVFLYLGLRQVREESI